MKEPKDASNVSREDLSTTSSPASGAYKIIIFPFEQYELTIRLTLGNEFVDVLEIKVNKDFLSHQQKMASLGSIDVESFL